MKCKNCGSNINKDDKFCIRCGFIFDKKVYDKDVDYQSFFQNKYEKSMRYSFCLEYLFLNFIYAFYKKMYVEGFLSFLSSLLLIKIIPNFFDLVVSSLGFYFMLYLFLCLLSIFIIVYYILNLDSLYNEKVNYVISKTIRENDSLNIEKIDIIIKRKLKNSLLLPIIFTVLYLIIVQLF